jgi:hypothetical protein
MTEIPQIPNVQALIIEKLYSMDEKIEGLQQWFSEALQTIGNHSEPYKTVEQTAAFLDCSKEHVYTLKKKIPYIFRGSRLFFRTADLIAYMEEGLVVPKSKIRKS